MKTTVFIVLTTFCITFARAGHPVGIDPMQATHTQAMTDFVNLLRADDVKTALERWCTADSKLDEFWKNLRECDQQHDYTNWITGKLKPKGGETRFVIGGHSYGHMHVEWQTTKHGWRIVKVWMCR